MACQDYKKISRIDSFLPIPAQTRNRNKLKAITVACMLKDSLIIGTGTVTVKNDPRILPFGKILRRAKINELPQLSASMRNYNDIFERADSDPMLTQH